MFQYIPLIRLYHFGLLAHAHLLRHRYDVAHLMSYSEVFGPLLRRVRKTPYLFHLIMREHWWPTRFDRLLFRLLIHWADHVAALTPKWAEYVSGEYGRSVSALSPPVDMEVFKPQGEKDLRHPEVLFTADLGDPRKGGSLLLRAWDEIYENCPGAKLVLAGPFGIGGFHPEVVANTVLAQLHLIRSPEARAAVEIRGPGSVKNFPKQYAEAAVTVLPSVDEAFGMVTTESLASGTPVVCSSYGGTGEIVSNDEIGATVPLRELLDLLDARRAKELAQAVLYAIDLARKAETVQRCRDWAEQWSLERVGRQTEDIYQELVNHNGRG
jgi:glycosyltransferase involved in cell wall biosynthesis